MRIAYLGTVYPGYAADISEFDLGLSYVALRAHVERDAFGWVGAWGPALEPMGWTWSETWLNLPPLLQAWAREEGSFPPEEPLEDIAIARIERFGPDVLWYDHHDLVLLGRIRARCPSLRAVVGWTGSMGLDPSLVRAFDLVLSCAPEAVEALRRGGARADHLDHAFNERVLDHLGPREPAMDVTFVGQLAADHPLHVHRERLLDTLLADLDVAVFSPAAGRRRPSPAAVIPRRLLYAGAESLRRAGVPESALRRLPLIGRAAGWPSAPRGPLPARLRAALRPGVFGLEMYRTLRASRVTLNVQGGPMTSNMRLFEATGAGACLLTDAAENLAGLFEPEREVATFRDAAECREQIRSLLSDDNKREAMAKAGQARCLAAHTFRHRAPRLVELVSGVVR